MTSKIELAEAILERSIEAILPPERTPVGSFVYLMSDVEPDIYFGEGDRVVVELTAEDAVTLSQALSEVIKRRQPSRECDGQLSLF